MYFSVLVSAEEILMHSMGLASQIPGASREGWPYVQGLEPDFSGTVEGFCCGGSFRHVDAHWPIVIDLGISGK